MRLAFPAPQPTDRVLLDPRRIVRWVYLGRLCLASAIFIAAVYLWNRAAQTDTLICSLIFASTMVFTVASAMFSEVYRRPLGQTFFYLQSLFDLLLVTAIVHVTGGSASQFTALYILVIVGASLLLPTGDGLLVAALGNVLYFADAIWGHDHPPDLGVWLQLGIFAVVALGSGYLGARLQEAGVGKEELAAELVKARLQAADVLRNIRSGIVTVGAGGDLLYANPAASALLGLELEQRLGQPILPLIAGVAPELSRAFERSITDGVRTTRGEATIDTGARRIAIGVTTTAFEEAAEPGAPSAATTTAIFQDISDQKRLESLRARTERLEAVAELSASLAHEIKNPLASIRSAVEQMARFPRATEDERTLGGLVMRESDRLSRLLSEFLDFARVRVTRIGRVDIGAIARGAATLAGSHPDRQEGVRVTCTTPPEPLMIDGDEDLLHRAVFNLALNAVQAIGPSGQVCVEVAPLPHDQLPPEHAFEQGGVSLRVSDDGPGISAEVRDRMFDPFFTTKSGGTGLGLPVVHRAIEAHRGLVYVDSTGRGTRFTVLLPRMQSQHGANQ